MAVSWENLAKVVRRDRAQIEEEAASAWLLEELRETDREIAGYVRRYSVTSPDEIEQAIRTGTLDGHPAWEDKLAWDNLLVHRERLLAAMAAVGGKVDRR